MTIHEAVSVVLSEYKDGLTAEEIYNRIIEKGLYKFGAKNPVNIVHIEISRRCKGVNYSNPSKERIFKICGQKNNKAIYCLIDNGSCDFETSLDEKIEKLKKKIKLLEKEYIEAIYELQSLEFEKNRKL